MNREKTNFSFAFGNETLETQEKNTTLCHPKLSLASYRNGHW